MKITGSSLSLASGVFKIIRYSFFFIFFIILIVSAISTGIKEKSLVGTVKVLGEAWVYPLNSASETASKIDNDEISGFFESIVKYFNLYYNLYIIYLWIWLLVKVGGMMPWSNTSAWFGNLLFAFFIFYFIQIIFNVAFLGSSIDTPFVKTYDLVKGIINLFSNPHFSSNFKIELNNSCSDSVCDI